MRIEHIETYVLKLPSPRAYLGVHDDGWDPRGSAEYTVRPPWRSLYSGKFETTLVSVHTNDGIIGWGEALAPVAPEVPAAIIDRLLAPQLIGQDPTAVRPLWEKLRGLMRERGHLVGHQADALAALDTALWDIAGQTLGSSVSDLLGGRHRDTVPAYISGLPVPTDHERAQLAEQWVERGATRIKLALGKGVDADLATFDAVAEAAPTVGLAIDAHWAYSLPDALRLGAELDARGALFLEAPLAPEDIDGHAELGRRVRTPIAVGEAMRNRYEFSEWAVRRALGLAQPDVARTGITEAIDIATVLSAHHIPTACHHSVGLGVALAAGIHVSAALPHSPFFEYQPDTVGVAQSLLRTPMAIGPAGFQVPTGPGLGIDIDIDTVRHLAEEA